MSGPCAFRYDLRMTVALPDALAFQSWLRERPGFATATVSSIAIAEGGASNLTCRVELEASAAIAVCLRIQRERGIFEPYDVLREGRVIAAFESTGIPAPRFIAAEADISILGAPFIVLEWIDAPHMGIAGPEADFGAFTEMVTRVHAVDWRAAGLDWLLVADSAHNAILAELDVIAARMPAFGCDDDPLLVLALATLRANAPTDGDLAFCQGDINVFNYLFRAKECVGVVDWEQARISDARSDIGHLVSLSHLKGAPWVPASQTNFVRAYQAVTGQPLANMAYFRARWLFELAVIYHGWVSFNDSEPWYSRADVEELLATAIAEV